MTWEQYFSLFSLEALLAVRHRNLKNYNPLGAQGEVVRVTQVAGTRNLA